jgi:hypothetical protein
MGQACAATHLNGDLLISSLCFQMGQTFARYYAPVGRPAAAPVLPPLHHLRGRGGALHVESS